MIVYSPISCNSILLCKGEFDSIKVIREFILGIVDSAVTMSNGVKT